jgi:NAD(P)-dependent dehydrogenase (short-subunit alcohol dehydrogenase family)
MRVAAIDAHAPSLRSLEEDIKAIGAECVGAVADVSDPSALQGALAAVNSGCRGIDVLVSCAAIDPRENQLEIPRESAVRQFDINLLPLLQLVEALVPAMQRGQFGRVIAIGSVQESRPRSDNLVYAALKAAQTHAILNWARHSTGGCVTFNVVRPGAIETARNRDVLSDASYRGAVVKRIPLGRLGQPGDCAGIVAWLCTDSANYVNGTVIDVDGGMRL